MSRQLLTIAPIRTIDFDAYEAYECAILRP